ncbi:ATPase [Saccharopolyspora sp. K220]|uniref:RapZ C-terminal domain-containing protein n=1 Tax=Saccharopolyspora soli TaxID=2926618 RepID=UPI001F59F3D1|nr:RNase adapter RapZ [Saccharopolyspora soli]MCI2422098.1 ATPase [Saccharopolyspora soli]
MDPIDSHPATYPENRARNGSASTSPGRTIRLISFGYRHGPPPRADRTEDLREQLRDPAAADDILHLTGREPRVQHIVLNTPGAVELLDNLVAYARLPAPHPRVIALGCAGGKHRAPSLTEELARRLRKHGHVVEIEHLHIDEPIADNLAGTP